MSFLFGSPSPAPAPAPKPTATQERQEQRIEAQEKTEIASLAARKKARRTGGVRLLMSPQSRAMGDVSGQVEVAPKLMG